MSERIRDTHTLAVGDMVVFVEYSYGPVNPTRDRKVVQITKKTPTGQITLSNKQRFTADATQIGGGTSHYRKARLESYSAEHEAHLVAAYQAHQEYKNLVYTVERLPFSRLSAAALLDMLKTAQADLAANEQA